MSTIFGFPRSLLRMTASLDPSLPSGSPLRRGKFSRKGTLAMAPPRYPFIYHFYPILILSTQVPVGVRFCVGMLCVSVCYVAPYVVYGEYWRPMGRFPFTKNFRFEFSKISVSNGTGLYSVITWSVFASGYLTPFIVCVQTVRLETFEWNTRIFENTEISTFREH